MNTQHQPSGEPGTGQIARKQILRKGLSPLVTTISTRTSAPVITGARLRAGKTNSGKDVLLSPPGPWVLTP